MALVRHITHIQYRLEYSRGKCHVFLKCKSSFYHSNGNSISVNIRIPLGSSLSFTCPKKKLSIITEYLFVFDLCLLEASAAKYLSRNCYRGKASYRIVEKNNLTKEVERGGNISFGIKGCDFISRCYPSCSGPVILIKAKASVKAYIYCFNLVMGFHNMCNKAFNSSFQIFGLSVSPPPG